MSTVNLGHPCGGKYRRIHVAKLFTYSSVRDTTHFLVIFTEPASFVSTVAYTASIIQTTLSIARPCHRDHRLEAPRAAAHQRTPAPPLVHGRAHDHLEDPSRLDQHHTLGPRVAQLHPGMGLVERELLVKVDREAIQEVEVEARTATAIQQPFEVLLQRTRRLWWRSLRRM